MKAVGYWQHGLPISDPRALEDLDLPDPDPPLGRDLLVRVHAVSVNPRDVKSRMAFPAKAGQPVVLGYDTSGVVEGGGPQAELFSPSTRSATVGGGLSPQPNVPNTSPPD